jgi:hypothetical protein
VPDVDNLKVAALTQLAAIDQQYSRIKLKRRHYQFGAIPVPDELAEFNASCLGAIDRLTSRHRVYNEQALRELDRHDLGSDELASALYGLIRSLKQDIDDGWLSTVREHQHASILGNLLDLASRSLKDGQSNPAAILMGSVLETHLQLLAAKHDVPLTAESDAGNTEPSTAGQLNDGLAQVAYGKTDHRNISLWLVLYRKATQDTHLATSAARIAGYVEELRGLISKYPA